MESIVMKRVERCGWWLSFLMTAWIAAACCAFAQTGATPDAGRSVGKVTTEADPAFEVATIKPTPPVTDGHTHINYPDGGSFSASNITLAALMQWAYDMPQKQILDGPPWMNSTRFDILAKSDAETDGRLRSLPSDQSHALKRRMVQDLLADRYALKLHREVRTLPAYDLVLAKDGSKLQESKSDGKSIGMGRAYFNGQGLTTELIAKQLSEIAGRIVLDKTNLAGRYDLKLRWTPDDAPTNDNSAPSLFTAIEEQLGLKLISAKEPIAVLVIDHIELPSPN
jgi:uncharacterized protein (TIGR03435 family)